MSTTETDPSTVDRPRTVAVVITAQCLSISQMYLCLGGSSRGRTQFRQLIGFVLPTENDDVKAAALPVFVFAIPLLIAGAACVLLLTWELCGGGDADSTEDGSLVHVEEDSALETDGHRHSNTKCQPLLRASMPSPQVFSAVFVLLPCLLFCISNISRHYQSAADTYPTFPDVNPSDRAHYSSLMSNYIDIREQVSNWRRDLLKHVANDSAMLALVAMAYLLVPISKQSPLVILSRWSPVEAVVVHKWAGRLGVFGVGMHGTLHGIIAYWRWWNAFAQNDTLGHRQTKRSFWYGYLPRWYCWKSILFGDPNYPSEEDAEDGSLVYGCYREKCTCYDFFLNLTGLIGMVALIVLGVTSVGYMRRHYYRLFYLVHITAGPSFIVMATLHYNRTILYLCPGILYYASTTLPIYIQNWMQYRGSDKGTRILSLTRISCPTVQRPNASVWDIAFEASYKAWQQYRPGQSGYLYVPQISIVKHPFTVNKIPGCHNRLRFLIRETGPFTFHLGRCLNHSFERSDSMQLGTEQDTEAQPLSGTTIPPMYITGFHGSSCRMQQLYSHDKVTIIAGGIGITQYLSLLLEVVDQQSSLTSSKVLKSLELHWICRDISLIRYIERQYFSEMLKFGHPSDEKPSFSLEIIVHYTGTEISPSTSNTVTFLPESVSQHCAMTSSMKPCHFSVGTNLHVSQNMFLFMTFSSIFSVGLWLVWLLFVRVQSKDAMATRLLPLFSILVSSVGLAIMFVHFSGENKMCCKFPMSSSTGVDNYSTVTKNDETYSSSALVSYKEQSTGRPGVYDILLSLKEAMNPGVFVCGPKQLMEPVRRAAMSSCHRCAVYEELFEL